MEKELIIVISAFSGLAGALLTQVLTGFFSFVQDRRKHRIDLQNQYRSKKLEIGENFYFVNGELMTMIRKNIDYWQNLRNDRSEPTLVLMKREMEKLDVYQQQLYTENWKYNLLGVYFNVPFGFEDIQVTNRRSHQLYLKVIDLANKLRHSSDETKDDYYQHYNLAIFDLISHYEDVYQLMQGNMAAVKEQLVGEFSVL